MRWRVTASLGLDRPWFVEDEELDVDPLTAWCPATGVRSPRTRRAGWPAHVLQVGPLPVAEMWVIEGVEGGRMATLTKMHHAIVVPTAFPGRWAGRTARRHPGTSRPPQEDRRSDLLIVDCSSCRAVQHALGRAYHRGIKTPFRASVGYRNRRCASRSPRWASAVAAGVLKRRRLGSMRPSRRTGNHRCRVGSWPVKRASRGRFRRQSSSTTPQHWHGCAREYLKRGERLAAHRADPCLLTFRTDENKSDALATRWFYDRIACHRHRRPRRAASGHPRKHAAAKLMAKALSAHRSWGLPETTLPFLRWSRGVGTATGLSRNLAPINLGCFNVPGPPFLPAYMAGANDSLVPLGPLAADIALNITCFPPGLPGFRLRDDTSGQRHRRHGRCHRACC